VDSTVQVKRLIVKQTLFDKGSRVEYLFKM